MLACLAGLVVSAGTASPTLGAFAPPRSSGIGGQVVGSPGEAPWSVLLSMRSGEEGGSCSGSIVDAAHVVTAAHCTFDEGEAWSLDAYSVVAGIADASQGGDRGEEQLRQVSSVRVGPSFVPGEFGDDVAVLRVEPSFDLSPPGVAAVPLVGQGGGLGLGGAARLFGWGQVESGRSDGRLRRLDQGLLEQWQCARGVPSVLCAWSAAGAACAGDSGGGLLSLGDSPVLLGVSNFVVFPSSACAAGNLTAYTDLSTPEVHAWLLGDQNPPRAPRTEMSALLWGELASRGTAICDAPAWTGDPQIATKFLYASPDSYATQVVQQGSSNRYELGPKDVGQRLVCVSVATNEGGTTESASWRPVLVGGRATELIQVRDAKRRDGRWRARLATAPSLRGKRLKVKWSAPTGCVACPATRAIEIERRTRLVSPRMPRGAQARLTLRLPALTVGEVPYRGSTLRVRLHPLGLARGRQASPLPSHVGQVRRSSLLEGAEGAR